MEKGYLWFRNKENYKQHLLYCLGKFTLQSQKHVMLCHSIIKRD